MDPSRPTEKAKLVLACGAAGCVTQNLDIIRLHNGSQKLVLISCRFAGISVSVSDWLDSYALCEWTSTYATDHAIPCNAKNKLFCTFVFLWVFHAVTFIAGDFDTKCWSLQKKVGKGCSKPEKSSLKLTVFCLSRKTRYGNFF